MDEHGAPSKVNDTMPLMPPFISGSDVLPRHGVAQAERPSVGEAPVSKVNPVNGISGR